MAATFESFKHRSPLAIGLQPAGAGVLPLSRSFTWSLRLLCCAALGVTGYLAVTAIRAGDVAGCGGGAVWDCGFALHSRWSKVLAVPVSIPAFALYAILLSALACCRPGVRKARLRLAWGIVSLGAFAAGLAAIWFVGLQVFAVGHLCIYCIAAHLCGLALCGAIVWKRPLGNRSTARLAGLSALAVGLLIATQVFSAPPPTYQVEYHPVAAVPNPTATPTNANAATAGSKPAEQTPAPEVIEPPSGVPNETAEN